MLMLILGGVCGVLSGWMFADARASWQRFDDSAARLSLAIGAVVALASMVLLLSYGMQLLEVPRG